MNNSSVVIQLRQGLAIFLVHMRRNSVNSASGLKNCFHHRVQRPRFLLKGLKLWRFDNTITEFWAYFHSACAETVIKELPVKNLTPPFAPATSISYKMHFHYRVTFTGYIRCFCATTSHDFLSDHSLEYINNTNRSVSKVNLPRK